MAQRAAALSGRKELLGWLNNLCNSTYPTVESLRDGAAYCTVVEAAISRISQNCAATCSQEAPIATSRAEHARALLGKVEWSATALVCESSDPSLDSVAVRTICSHNMQLLQDMLHDCVPAEHRYTVEAARLASGKLQDHVLLLRWLYLFMSKVLAHYSRKALERRAEVLAGAVEGVKLNRAALLRSHQINAAGEQRGRSAAPASEVKAGSVPLQTSPSPPMAEGRLSGASPRSGQPPLPLSSALHEKGTCESRSPEGAAREPAGAKVRGHCGGKGGLAATPLSSSPNKIPASAAASEAHRGLNEKVVHSHYTRGTVAIPEHLRDVLVPLRNEVESVEGIVLYVQEQHNFYLTRPAGASERYSPSLVVRNVENESQYRLDARDTLSLEELGELLEERDALAQQYAALDATVTRALRKAQFEGKAPSLLLRDIVDLLHPQ